MPRRSSTRASTTVVSPTLCCGRVEDDVDGIRPVGGGQDRVGRMAGEQLALPLMRCDRFARSLRTDGGQAGGIEQQRRAVEGERRFGAFVVVRRLARRGRRSSRPWRSRTAAAGAGCGRGTSRTTCCARNPCSGSPVTAKAASSASTNADASSGCSSPVPGAGSSRSAAAVAGQPEDAVREPGLVSEPAERVEPRLRQVRPAQRDAADDQRVRETGVVVGELSSNQSQPRAACVGVGGRQLLQHPFEHALGPPGRAGPGRGARARGRRRRPSAARPSPESCGRSCRAAARSARRRPGTQAVERISPSAQTERPTWSPRCGSSSQRRS